jgi:hypothetical protein
MLVFWAGYCVNLKAADLPNALQFSPVDPILKILETQQHSTQNSEIKASSILKPLKSKT